VNYETKCRGKRFYIEKGGSVMDAKEFMENVYDNLMKNTNHNPVDFAKTKGDCFIDCDKNEIVIGKFKLKVKEVA
tara:strand:+ start:423 stop:647 length:225 start_codon:yes stop_codon:yes gene_type:complete